MKMVIENKLGLYPGKKVEYGNHITLTVQFYAEGMG
jgi:hypothetical protein